MKLRKLNQKKAQMKIQEMAFVLLALVLLAVISFVFFIRLSSQKITESAEDVKTTQAKSLIEKVSSLAELECRGKALCIDEDKAVLFKAMPEQDKAKLLQGLSSVKILRLYSPYLTEDITTLYGSQANSSYSTFINTCKYKAQGNIFNYECGIAMLVVGN